MRKTIQNQRNFSKIYLLFLLFVFFLSACDSDGSSMPQSTLENEITPTPTSEIVSSQIDDEEISPSATPTDDLDGEETPEVEEKPFDGKMRMEEVEGLSLCQVIRFEMTNPDGVTYKVKITTNFSSEDDFIINQIDSENLMEYLNQVIEGMNLSSIPEGETIKILILDYNYSATEKFIEDNDLKFFNGSSYKGVHNYSYFYRGIIHPEYAMELNLDALEIMALDAGVNLDSVQLEIMFIEHLAGMFVAGELQLSNPQLDSELVSSVNSGKYDIFNGYIN